MEVVGPLAPRDIPALLALAEVASPGVHTLPRTPATAQSAVERTASALRARPDAPGDEIYMFVLEDDEGRMLGTASIAATAGAKGTFFAFRDDVLHQGSRDLGVSHSVHALSLSSALTACSQLSGFYLNRLHADAADSSAEAALLSRARLLFAAGAPERFAERFFASMPGITDAEGRSPFWEALGRKFFNMDFLEAERLIEGARNRTLIVELMPHYPVYVPLLPTQAQAALGQVHPQGMTAYSMLRAEGFGFEEYTDIFDGGPILQAHRSAVRSIADSLRCTVVAGIDEEAVRRPFLVSNGRDESFRAVLVEAGIAEGEIALDEGARRALEVALGDHVLCAAQ